MFVSLGVVLTSALAYGFTQRSFFNTKDDERKAFVQNLVFSALESRHYNAPEIDDDFSKKAFEEYSAYDYGVISKLLAKWINFYESRQKVQEDKK